MTADGDGNVLSTIDPKSIKRIHLVGVAGTGMGSFAGMLKAAGYEVTGSDENVYPPMSDQLRAWGIDAMAPYAPANLDRARPDLVIIGNVIRRVNPEAAEVRARGFKSMSFPAALGSLFLETRHSVVIAGTHGKTTTSALMGQVLVDAGEDPTFLVGGVTLDSKGNYRLGKGKHFVVEGDEYDTAYFDKGPKFLHYRPRTVILTSVEFDHADIYRDLPHYTQSFEKLVALMPQDGTLVAAASYPNVLALAKASKSKVLTYEGKEGSKADYAPQGLRFSGEGARFVVRERGQALGEVLLRMGGAHNVENALGVFAAGRALGLSFEQLAHGIQSFSGVKRRQEPRGEPRGILVLDDFAHHPTAVRETVAAVKGRYAGRRLWAIFEPRSNTSRRNIHQDDYAHAFTGADRASVKVPDPHDKIPSGEGLDVPRLAKELTAGGIPTFAAPDVPALLDEVVEGARPGDVLLVMSNGAFGGFIDKLLTRLENG
jgi:UDP-N-acetylmuramate: L-alanyl-gamma-D-glutamyl-meso-diaminopimelate ligase